MPLERAPSGHLCLVIDEYGNVPKAGGIKKEMNHMQAEPNAELRSKARISLAAGHIGGAAKEKAE